MLGFRRRNAIRQAEMALFRYAVVTNKIVDVTIR